MNKVYYILNKLVNFYYYLYFDHFFFGSFYHLPLFVLKREKKDIKFAKKSGIRRFEEEIRDKTINHSMDRVKHRTYKNNRRMGGDYNMDEILLYVPEYETIEIYSKFKQYLNISFVNCFVPF